MINYRNNKLRFKPNELGSLYIDSHKLESGERPVIYIGGQMEHRCHILEQTGFTFDPGHNMFTGSWFYDYPIFRDNKDAINARTMAENFLKALKMASLGDVDIITESFGGLIGAYATLDARIHMCFAIHPPITGTPLANPQSMSKYKELFTKREKLLLLMMKKLINTNYGFEKDNNKGITLNEVDLNKLLVIGSTIDIDNEKNTLVKSLNEMILKYCGYQSDGVVIFSEELFDKMGINYFRELPKPSGLNHFDAGSEEHLTYIKNIFYPESRQNSKSFSLQPKNN